VKEKAAVAAIAATGTNQMRATVVMFLLPSV